MHILSTSLDVPKSIVNVVFSLSFLISAFIFAILATGLYLGSTYSLQHGHTVIRNIDYMYRCVIYPDMSTFIPLLNTISNFWEKITCWTNSLGLLNRLMSTKYLTRAAKACLNGGSLLKVIEKVAFGLGSLFDQTVIWLGNNPFLFSYPIYPTLLLVNPISIEANKFLLCECDLLDPFYRVLLNPYQNETLACAGHQVVNGAIGFPQVIGRYITGVFVDISTLLQQGDIYGILKVFYGNSPTNEFYFYLSHEPYEKLISGIVYLGEWLDVAFKNAICVIVSEAKAGSISDAAVDLEYAQCRITMEPIKLFCIITKTAAAAVRTVRIIVEVILYVVRFLNPFDDFRQTQWNPNIIWDSIRVPLSYMNASFIQGLSSTNVTTCNETSAVTNTTLTCTECNLLSTTSLEECFCSNFVQQIDNLVDGEIGIRIFKPILCDFAFGIVRVAVALGKFVTDNVRFFPFETVPYWSRYESYDAILDELAGPSYKFDSGVFYSPISLIKALLPQYPSLVILPSVITYPLKFVVEVVRYILHLVANTCKDFLQLPPPFAFGAFLTNYLCVDRNIGSYCLNPEDALQWLRTPRNISLIQNDFVSYNTTAGDATLEFVCQIFNLSFLSSLNIPELMGFDVPDLCCFVYNFGRSIVEIVSFLLKLILAFIQTVIELTSYGNPYNRIFVLDFVSCLEINATSPCSNINCILNDLSAILGCGCLTIEDIESIPGVSGTLSIAPLNCLCTAFTGVTSVLANTFIELRNAAQLALGVFSCIDTNTGQFRNTTECRTVLPDKMADLFTRINTIFGLIGITVENLVCAFGSLLNYDCVNSITTICIEIDFDNCVRVQCNTFNPADPITNNGFPSSAQYSDCVNQCGPSICAACNATMQATLAFYGGSATTNCPNPCATYPCQPRDRLKVLASRLWAFFEGYIKIITNLLADIFLYGINQAGGNSPNAPNTFPFSLGDYVDLILTATGNGLFGSATDNTWGIMQAFGDTLNCLIGPSGCTDTTLNLNATPCFGNLFLILGNLLQQLYPGIVNIITDIVVIVESLITGDSSNLGNAIKNLIFDILDFVFNQLLGNIGVALSAIGSFLAAIISWIVTFGNPNLIYAGLNTFIQAILNIVEKIVTSITKILKFFGVKLKREFHEETVQNFQNDYNLTDEQMQMIQDPHLLLTQITPDTYCYRVISELANKASYSEMSISEELAYRMCYNMVLVPIVNNANPDKTITLPIDITYNTETMLNTITNGIKTLNAYIKWNTPSEHVYSLLSWSPSQKRDTSVLINTIPYGSNFTSFLVDQNLLNPDKKEDNIVHQLIGYTETNMTDQSVQGMTDYASQVQNYLADNPSHVEEYTNKGTMQRFTLYYSTYIAMLRSHIARNVEKRELLQKVKMRRVPSNMVEKKKPVSFDQVFLCASNTFKKTLPQFINQKLGILPSQKRNTPPVQMNQDSLNIIYFALDHIYVERARLVLDVFGFIVKKQIAHFTEKITKIGETMASKVKVGQIASGRMSILDRISTLHKQLTKIPALKSVMPELPPVVHELTQSIGKQRLVTVNCTCNCSIVENFLQEAIDILTYCYEVQVLKRNISLVEYHGPLVEIIAYNASNKESNVIVDWIDSQLGISIFSTATAFFEQTNRKKHLGPVGFLYFAEPLIPFISRSCERVNLTCEMGIGLERAVLYTLIGVAVYLVIVCTFFQPIASFVQVVVIGFIFSGAVGFGLSMTVAGLAWGYEVKCFTQPDGTILSSGLGLTFLPLLPQCTIPKLNAFIQTYIITATPLASFAPLGLLDIMNSPSKEVYLQPGGYPCPNKVDVQSCYDYGVTSIWVLVGMTLTRFLPPVATWLRYSCLVRGGCGNYLALSTPNPQLTNDGWLAGLFDSYNTTAFENGLDPKLNFCYWWNVWGLIIIVILIYILAPILWPIINLVFDIIKLIILTLVTAIISCKYEEDKYIEKETSRFLGEF